MQDDISIIGYNDSHRSIFKEMNMEWLDRYNLTEEPDLIVLNDPRGQILDKGGYIWLAQAGSEIIGSVALIREGDTVYELAKMFVAEPWRGKGISRKLIETSLAKAKEIGATRLLLFSNHQLQTAIGLYEKYGFRHIEVHDSPFVTADVMMELLL